MKNLPTAKKNLSTYNNLNRLFNNFENYEQRKYDFNHNIIFGYALPDLTGKDMPNHKQILGVYDYLLDIFQIVETHGKEYNDLRARLISNDYNKSAFAFSELYVANLFAVKFGLKNVRLYPKLSNGVSDVSVKLDNQEIFFEVTNNELSKPEEIIFKILEKVAEHIGKKIDHKKCHIYITLDPKYLKRDINGNLDIDASVNYLCVEADKLKISKLAGYDGEFFLEIAWLSVKIDESVRRNNPQYNGFKKMIKYPKEWLLEQTSEIIQNNPFIMFSCGYSDVPQVMIDTSGNMDFSLEEYKMDGFFEHIKRKIQYKIDKGQFESDHPNILIIQGTNSIWNIHGHTERLSDFITIRKKISKFLSDNQFENLSGVIWFNINLENAKLILNPNVDKNSKLNDEVITKLGFAIHDDMDNYGYFLG